MKSGENMLVKLIDRRVNTAINGMKGLYLATVIDTSPLTIQPKVLTADGKKQVPIRDVRQLDFDYSTNSDYSPRKLKKNDDVLVGVIADSTAYYEKGKDLREDPDRYYSVDSSIVLGVIK